WVVGLVANGVACVEWGGLAGGGGGGVGGGDGGVGGGGVGSDGEGEGAEHRGGVGVFSPAGGQMVGAEGDDGDTPRPHRVGEQHHAVVRTVSGEHLVAGVDLVAHAARNGDRDDVEDRDALRQPQGLQATPAASGLERLQRVPAPAAQEENAAGQPLHRHAQRRVG